MQDVGGGKEPKCDGRQSLYSPPPAKTDCPTNSTSMTQFFSPGKSGCSPAASPPVAPPGIAGTPCEICIRPGRACHRSTVGVSWCVRRCDVIPGYRIVGRSRGLTGYRRVSSVAPAPDTRERLADWVRRYGEDAVAQVRAALEQAEVSP